MSCLRLTQEVAKEKRGRQWCPPVAASAVVVVVVVVVVVMKSQV